MVRVDYQSLQGIRNRLGRLENGLEKLTKQVTDMAEIENAHLRLNDFWVEATKECTSSASELVEALNKLNSSFVFDVKARCEPESSI